MPPLKSAVRQTFVLYIYTRQEIGRLLAATSSCQQSPNCMIHAETFHALLLTLYATGARLGEAVGLRCKDVNFKTGMLNIKELWAEGGRVIPLNRQLREQLRSYVDWRTQENIGGEHLFTNENGGPIPTSTVRHNFVRLCRVSEVIRRCGSPLDLGCTICVRLSPCIGLRHGFVTVLTSIGCSRHWPHTWVR
jgi:integrase/recombinase XerD